MRVLVVEDSVKMAALLKRGLEEDGYAADIAATAEDALWLGAELSFDAIVLDVVLSREPGAQDGFDLCRTLRKAGDWTPILMLTARDAVDDRIRGLDAGADDYLTKPFAFDELAARIRALIRRGAGERPVELVAGDLRLDPSTSEVHRGDRPIALTGKERALLEYFMRHQGEVLSRSRLLGHLWDFAFDGNSNVVDVHVRNLREKIDRPFGLESIHTLRGEGYRFHVDTDPA
ncbi:MAG: two-component system, OmpR family, response regulator [Actinomycetota bacterium]|nr:two-component system, OmpR family, response regulator [Actinomycetota bacterium]